MSDRIKISEARGLGLIEACYFYPFLLNFI